MVLFDAVWAEWFEYSLSVSVLASERLDGLGSNDRRQVTGERCAGALPQRVAPRDLALFSS